MAICCWCKRISVLLKKKNYSAKIFLCSATFCCSCICQRPHTWKASPMWAFVEETSVRCHTKGGGKTDLMGNVEMPQEEKCLFSWQKLLWSMLDTCCTFSDTFWMAFYNCRCLGLIAAWYQLTVKLFAVWVLKWTKHLMVRKARCFPLGCYRPSLLLWFWRKSWNYPSSVPLW